MRVCGACAISVSVGAKEEKNGSSMIPNNNIRIKDNLMERLTVVYKINDSPTYTHTHIHTHTHTYTVKLQCSLSSIHTHIF